MEENNQSKTDIDFDTFCANLQYAVSNLSHALVYMEQLKADRKKLSINYTKQGNVVKIDFKAVK